MFGRFCRLSPTINISALCLSLKVSLTVGQLSLLLLLSTLLLRPYKFSTITRQGFFFYSCLLRLPLILASLIYYSVFNLAIWGLSPRLVTGKPPLNWDLIRYIWLQHPAHNIPELTIRGVIDITTISSCHYPSNLSVIVCGLFRGTVTLEAKEKHLPFLKCIHVCVAYTENLSIELCRGAIGSKQSRASIGATFPQKLLCLWQKFPNCSRLLLRVPSHLGCC